MVDLYKEAQNILRTKASGGKNTNPKLTVADLQHLFQLAMEDNILQHSEVKQLLQVRSRYRFSNMTEEAVAMMEKFYLATEEDKKGGNNHSKNHIMKSQPKAEPVSSSTTQSQCGICVGMGTVICSSCSGMGGQSQMRVEYDHNNNASYHNEWITCGLCSSGHSTCSACGGSGFQ